MSRIGRNIIQIPEGVEASLSENAVFQAKGKKGGVSLSVPRGFDIVLNKSEIKVSVKGGEKHLTKGISSMYGTLVRQISLVLRGVSEGFEKTLSLVGVGYKAELIEGGRVLKLSLGYSHDILHALPEGIEVSIEKPTLFKILGTSKQEVGQTAATIMRYRPPEPYKGKGIQVPGQYIRRKEGKSK